MTVFPEPGTVHAVICVGFGLHCGALAARELGGSLTAESEGSGCGATFTLELPLCAEPANGEEGV